MKIFKYLNGWKTVLSYVLAQVFGSYPLLLTAFNDLMADSKNPQKIINFLIQLGLALGVGHIAIKNVAKLS